MTPRGHERRQRQETNKLKGESTTKISLMFFSVKDEDEGEECDICIEKYVQGGELDILPCIHRFHLICIRHWIVDGMNVTCPRCTDVV